MTTTESKPYRIDLVGSRQPDGSILAGGVMTGPNGTMSLTCKLSGAIFSEPAKRGRGRPKGKAPKKIAEHVATLAHLYMSAHLHPDWGKMARVLHFRETVWGRTDPNHKAAPDDEYRSAMEWVKSGKEATKNSCGYLSIIPFDNLAPAHWLAMDSFDAFSFDQERDITGIDGNGWICRWGDKKAVYGRLTCKPAAAG